MQIMFSVNKPMARWLAEPQALPIMTASTLNSTIIADEEQTAAIGTVPLLSNSQQSSWQCSVMEHPASDERYTVIMVEAYSRYTILIPYQSRPSLYTLETDFIARWLEDMTRFGVASGRLKRDQVNQLFQQFMSHQRDFHWYQNCDMSLQGHVVDAECSLMNMLVDAGQSFLSAGRAETMAQYLNAGDRTAAKGQAASLDSFLPVERFLQDALFRFAQGMAAQPYAVNAEGNFADPYIDQPTQSGQVKDNVVGIGRFGQTEN